MFESNIGVDIEMPRFSSTFALCKLPTAPAAAAIKLDHPGSYEMGETSGNRNPPQSGVLREEEITGFKSGYNAISYRGF